MGTRVSYCRVGDLQVLSSAIFIQLPACKLSGLISLDSRRDISFRGSTPLICEHRDAITGIDDSCVRILSVTCPVKRDRCNGTPLE